MLHNVSRGASAIFTSLMWNEIGVQSRNLEKVSSQSDAKTFLPQDLNVRGNRPHPFLAGGIVCPVKSKIGGAGPMYASTRSHLHSASGWY